MSSTMSVADEGSHRLLVYRGFRFRCGAQPMGSAFQPVVVLLAEGDRQEATLPDDTEEVGYATQAEALRHGEQQAIRWVHDRTGSGQAQF